MHVEFEDYDGFFSLITEECNAEEFTYLDWSCTPNKSEVCQDIKGIFTYDRWRYKNMDATF